MSKNKIKKFTHSIFIFIVPALLTVSCANVNNKVEKNLQIETKVNLETKIKEKEKSINNVISLFTPITQKDGKPDYLFDYGWIKSKEEFVKYNSDFYSSNDFDKNEINNLINNEWNNYDILYIRNYDLLHPTNFSLVSLRYNIQTVNVVVLFSSFLHNQQKPIPIGLAGTNSMTKFVFLPKQNYLRNVNLFKSYSEKTFLEYQNNENKDHDLINFINSINENKL